MTFRLRFRDPMSGLTHFIGALLAIAGLVVLVVEAAMQMKVWHIVAFSIFGAGMILLYTASTLYHWLPLRKKGTMFLRKFDHMMIAVLIAASYTPICLIPLRGGWGWSLFGVIWGLAVANVFIKLFWMTAPRWLSTGIYLLMGWMAIIAIYPMIQTMQVGALLWLVAGGLFYTVGAVIYALKKPNLIPRILGFHEIFHIFVMLGSFAHFWLMYKYLMVLG